MVIISPEGINKDLLLSSDCRGNSPSRRAFPCPVIQYR